MSQRDLDRYTALSTADVHKIFVIGPREFKCQCLGDAHAEAGHGAQELFQSGGVGVNGSEKVFPSPHLVLWLARFWNGGQVCPKTIKACDAHLPDGAGLARVGPVAGA